ncbi:organic solute transporter Ostalpha-domain-containing protein [Aspergillus coremiiformis]|uniref:Organic solute transporter Ostalpha-domain-containing protein n=1 Tax=Aspergillus coremiiformis TaxID=138285 RepID=A0A5N6Z9D4_9EURO|nr:organic solute transporter Ostalpha-domain-containing protein [Aspergillus coremiiformis]
MVPVYSLVAWLSIFFYRKSVYFSVIGDCYEAFTISAFFALLCHYIAPDLRTQKEYFRGIEPKPWIWPLTWLQRCCGGQRGLWRTPRSGLTWFNIVWVSVFQYCLLRVLMTIVAVVSQHLNVYCEESLNPAFSHIWCMAIECIAVTIAMYCLVQFYVQIKDDISQYSPFLKILSIKLVIFLSFWQTICINFLLSAGVIKPTKTIAEQDLKVGLPNLLISVEMAIFGFLHLWAFSWKPYSIGNTAVEVTDFFGNGKATYQGGRWGLKALADCLNPWDLVKAISRSIRWLFVGRKKRMLDPSYRTSSEAIGLDTAGNGASGTAYQGAGSRLTSGRPGHYSPDEEGADLLSNAQQNPTSRPAGDLGLNPPPYEDVDTERYYPSHHQLSSSDLLDSTTHSQHPYSPYDNTLNSPFMVPSDSESNHHDTSPISHHNAPYPPDTLQQQPPIPMPESYHSSHHSADRGGGRTTRDV